MGMVLRRSLVHALLGVAIGTAGALALGPFLENRLFGVEATDVATITAVGALLALVTVFASWLPARRATSANPVASLRTE